MKTDIRKRTIHVSLILFFLVFLFFLPFFEDSNRKISLFLYSNIFGVLLGNESYSVNDLPYVLETAIISILLFIFIIIMLIFAVVIKKGKYRYLFISIALSTNALNYIVRYILYVSITPYLIPSWSFYLSIFLLIGYLLSPLYYSKLSNAVSKLYDKIKIQIRKPTKAERIAQLEREVEELKKEDTNNSISSNED